MAWRRTVTRVNGYPLYGPEGPDRAAVRRGKAMRPCFLEKALRINPPAVPKPTQVDEERILRPTEELQLRN